MEDYHNDDRLFLHTELVHLQTSMHVYAYSAPMEMAEFYVELDRNPLAS